MTRAQRNNNPLNLKYARQTESTGKDDAGFAIFPTPDAGWRAAHRQIKLDQKRGLTLKEFIFKFAPPEGNDTNAYLEFVVKELGRHCKLQPLRRWPLIEISPYAIAGIMAQFEGWYKKD